MRTLLLDIETSPNLAHVWSLWNQNVGLDQLRESGEVICFAAKWLGEPKRDMIFSSIQEGRENMIGIAYTLLNTADAVVHWNGRKFDTPHLNRAFIEGGLKPPSPFRQIDLCDVVKKQFRFPSNKLDYVAQRLGVGSKIHHEGHSLWVKCLEGDAAAWKRMETYNRQDVWLLEGLYRKLQPWIPGHPSWAAETGQRVCPNCGSSRLQARGMAYTLQSAYQRYQCQGCGKWSRETRRSDYTTIREVAAQ